MLLEFKMKNFKSFKNELNFKMIPSKIKDLEYSLISKEIKGKKIKALSSAAIYGPNSAGKTNIIGGMDVFRSIILNGNIRNKEVITTPNNAAYNLELIPNVESSSDTPVSFGIKFFTQNLIIELKLDILIGKFLDYDFDRKIINEELYVNNILIYNRNENLTIGKIETIKSLLIENFSKETAEKIAKTNLDNKELFFNGMFKSLYSKKLFDIIYLWFKNQFKIIYHADRIQYSPVIATENKDKKYFVDKHLNKALKSFGLTSKQIAYPINCDKDSIDPLSMIEYQDGRAILPAEMFESFGTIRFLNIFPIILKTIMQGATLVVDELDASIHPMAIMNIINIFHNDEINTKGAQLIFNTHNPIFLNNALLRRDEIKFVEKEENGSIQYSLSDFGTNGIKGVRNTEDYMKNYFINKYGAIKDIDFSEIFIDKEVIENRLEKNM